MKLNVILISLVLITPFYFSTTPRGATTTDAHGPSAELVLVAKVVEAEARGEGDLAKYLVASSIFNRVNDPRFPDEVFDVVEQRYQYASPHQTYSDASFQAAIRAAKSPDERVLYFYNPDTATDTIFISGLRQCFQVDNQIYCKHYELPKLPSSTQP